MAISPQRNILKVAKTRKTALTSETSQTKFPPGFYQRTEAPLVSQKQKKKSSKCVAKVNDELKQNNCDENENAYPTPYVLSTITATGSIGCHVDLNAFYDFVTVDDIMDQELKKDGYTYIEWGRKNETTFCKGFHKKMLVNHKTKEEGKRFDKQTSVILRKYDAKKETYTYQNLKIFFNGSVQMTGLKTVEQGK